MKGRGQIAIEALDEVARAMEVKWGVDRLPRVVAADLAAKFWSQLGKLNAAIEAEQAAIDWRDRERAENEVVKQAERMRNAWMALNGAAEAAGADPLSPGYLEARMPDGRLLVICGDLQAHHKLAAEKRAAVVWSLEEITRVLWQFELVNEAKVVWPGAKVEVARVDPERKKPPVDWKQGDQLPDVLMAG